MNYQITRVYKHSVQLSVGLPCAMHGKEYIFLVPWLFEKFFFLTICSRRSGSSAVDVYAEKKKAEIKTKRTKMPLAL